MYKQCKDKGHQHRDWWIWYSNWYWRKTVNSVWLTDLWSQKHCSPIRTSTKQHGHLWSEKWETRSSLSRAVEILCSRHFWHKNSEGSGCEQWPIISETQIRLETWQHRRWQKKKTSVVSRRRWKWISPIVMPIRIKQMTVPWHSCGHLRGVGRGDTQKHSN